MTIAAYLTLAIILSALFLLILTRIPAPAIFFGALAAAMTLKLAPVEELLKGFSNRGTLTTNIITNNAAAAFMYPIAFATARQLDISFLPFAIVLMMAASCAFIVPRGYQTNMMVWAAGGYRATDFIKLGFAITLTLGLTTLVITPLVFPF